MLKIRLELPLSVYSTCMKMSSAPYVPHWRKFKKKKSALPDRWEKYIPYGKPVANSRFIAFKVPLRPQVAVPEADGTLFTPDNMLNAFDRDNIDVGLIVDLTFTKRYYDRSVIDDLFGGRRIAYSKILTEGHVVPAKHHVDHFQRVVDDFLRNDPDRLVGVHCTHGLNRTGYMVCRYLIERLGWDAEEAIRAFDQARGHKQERDNYLEDLRSIGGVRKGGKGGSKGRDGGGYDVDLRTKGGKEGSDGVAEGTNGGGASSNIGAGGSGVVLKDGSISSKAASSTTAKNDTDEPSISTSGGGRAANLGKPSQSDNNGHSSYTDVNFNSGHSGGIDRNLNGGNTRLEDDIPYRERGNHRVGDNYQYPNGLGHYQPNTPYPSRYNQLQSDHRQSPSSGYGRYPPNPVNERPVFQPYHMLANPYQVDNRKKPYSKNESKSSGDASRGTSTSHCGGKGSPHRRKRSER